MKTLYYYDPDKLTHVEYPWWKRIFNDVVSFLMGMFWMWLCLFLMNQFKDKPKVQYRNIMYQDSTTIVYQPINPDSIKGDSKVAKDLRWYYRKNKK